MRDGNWDSIRLDILIKDVFDGCIWEGVQIKGTVVIKAAALSVNLRSVIFNDSVYDVYYSGVSSFACVCVRLGHIALSGYGLLLEWDSVDEVMAWMNTKSLQLFIKTTLHFCFISSFSWGDALNRYDLNLNLVLWLVVAVLQIAVLNSATITVIHRQPTQWTWRLEHVQQIKLVVFCQYLVLDDQLIVSFVLVYLFHDALNFLLIPI